MEGVEVVLKAPLGNNVAVQKCSIVENSGTVFIHVAEYLRFSSYYSVRNQCILRS